MFAQNTSSQTTTDKSLSNALKTISSWELSELHVHVGAAVAPPILWEMAHMQGIRLPTKNYWEFVDLITVHDKTDYDTYVTKFFHWTELIQSSPEAIARSIHSIIGGAYRVNNITTIELRFNPMLRNRGGERDLDHIILSSIHAMEQATMEYPVRAGLILMFDRRFTSEQNAIIAQKAIAFAHRGVVGVDIGGPLSNEYRIEDLTPIFAKCKKAGLKTTFHTGEVTGPDEVWRVLELINPDRIGHGIRSVEDEKLLQELAKRNITLEVCPSSNLKIQAVKSISEMKTIFEKLKAFKVPFCINTDGPEMLGTHLRREYMFILEHELLTLEDLKIANETGHRASFIQGGNHV